MATTLSRCRPLPEPTAVDLGIAGRKALLIGASRGLGKACALALAKEGVDVTIMARTRDVLERTCEEIGAATGVKAVPVVGDIIRSKAGKPQLPPVLPLTSCSTMRMVLYREISATGPARTGSLRSTP